MLSTTGGIADALNITEAFRPMADMLGLDTTGAPNADQVAATRTLVANLGADQVLVGDAHDSDRRIDGMLLGSNLLSEIEGFA